MSIEAVTQQLLLDQVYIPPVDLYADDSSSELIEEEPIRELTVPAYIDVNKVRSFFIAASIAATVMVKPSIGITSIISDENSMVFDQQVNLFGELGKTSTDIDYETKINAGFEKQVKELFDKLSSDALFEEFREGEKSNFSKSLEMLINKHSDTLLTILTEVVNDKDSNVEILAESFRVVGNNSNFLSRHKCFQFVNLGLQNKSPIIRDSAALAFADIEDPIVIPFLQDAVEREQLLSLKNDMQDIIDELEEA